MIKFKHVISQKWIYYNLQDYKDIFMSGGLNNPNDPFLRGVSCLTGWPRHLLANDPKRATLAFYK